MTKLMVILLVALIQVIIKQSDAACTYPYTVVAGDTCANIASRCGYDYNYIVNNNNNQCGTGLQIGAVICLPGYCSYSAGYNNGNTCAYPYVVKSGDSCANIASRCGYDYNYIVNNNYQCGTGLQVGQTLCLPGNCNVYNYNAASACAYYYTVQSGDSCSNIAARCGYDEKYVVSNNYKCGYSLQVGDRICLPGACSASSTYYNGGACAYPYTVKSGDSCYGISASCGYSYNYIANNNYQCGTGLQVGQTLCLPGYCYATSYYNAGTNTNNGGTNCAYSYVVKSGESCASIASRCNFNLATVTNSNSNCGPNLAVGATICLPGYCY